MRILCLLLAVITVTYSLEEAEEEKRAEKVNARKGSDWRANKVESDKMYDYNSDTMTPLRFRTVENTDSSLTETWLTFYYGDYLWGQLRFSSNGWGVELYACTDSNLYDNNNVMTGVPTRNKKTWSVHWDSEKFYLDCNGKKVWSFEFKDSIFPDRDCRAMYTEERGALTQFEFNGDRRGINLPIKYYTKRN